MKTTYLFIFLVLMGSLIAKSQSISERLNKINNYTKRSDPYKRFFTYNESTGKLKWVTGEGDITCEAKLSEVKVYKENSYVSFSTKDGSKSISCSYGGNTQITSITVNSSSDADAIVSEIQAIASNGSNSDDIDVASVLNRINELCSEYDNAGRIFSYNSSKNELTWITKKGDITCKANLEKITITMTPASSYNQVTFTCKDGGKCIECNYGGPVNLTAVSIERKEAPAIEIVEKLNLLIGQKNTIVTGGDTDIPQAEHK